MSLWSLDFGTWNSGDCKTHHGSVLQRIQVLARTWCKARQVSIRWVWRPKFPHLSLYLWPNSIMHASHLIFNKLIELIPKKSFLHWIHNTFQTTSLVASLVKPHQASCLVETEWENSKQADHLRYPKPPNITLPRGGFRLFKASARMEDSRRRAKTESGINPEALLMQKSPIMVTYPTLEIEMTQQKCQNFWNKIRMDEQASRKYVEKSHHTNSKLYRTDSNVHQKHRPTYLQTSFGCSKK